MGRRLRALGEAVGHPLFQRTSDGFVLTEPPERDVWIGYHHDLRGLARLRALLDATFSRFA